jgi:hypothetical protein
MANQRCEPRSGENRLPFMCGASAAEMTTLHTLGEVAARWQCRERWIADQLRAGRFPGHKIGRSWRMSDEDIAEAEAIMCRPARIKPQPISAQPTGGLGLTPTSRRRLMRR